MLDPIRERFTQEYQATGNASEALRRANPKAKNWKPETLHVKACNMLKEDRVQVRLSELQIRSAEKHGVTIDSLTDELQAALEKAMNETRGASAAVTAIMGKAKLHGLIVEKNEHTGKDGEPLVPVLNLALTRNKS